MKPEVFGDGDQTARQSKTHPLCELPRTVPRVNLPILSINDTLRPELLPQSPTAKRNSGAHSHQLVPLHCLVVLLGVQSPGGGSPPDRGRPNALPPLLRLHYPQVHLLQLVPKVLHGRYRDVVMAQRRRVDENGRSVNVLEACGQEGLVFGADDEIEVVWEALRGLYVAEQVHPVLDAGRVKHLARKKGLGLGLGLRPGLRL
jgi:hypothetical protein